MGCVATQTYFEATSWPHRFEHFGLPGSWSPTMQISFVALMIGSPIYALMIALIIRAIVVLVGCYNSRASSSKRLQGRFIAVIEPRIDLMTNARPSRCAWYGAERKP